MTAPDTLVEQFKCIVQATSDDVLEKLQVQDRYIKCINFIHGPVEEVRETLKQYDKSGTYRFKKYPLVVLITPFTELEGQSGGYFDKIVGNIGIAHHTRKDLKSNERYDQNIKRVLIPLYESLMDNIVNSGNYVVTTVRQLKHERVIRDDIGRKPFLNLEGITYDYIDAIEVKNLELTREYGECKTC